MAANAFHLRAVNPRNADALAEAEEAPQGEAGAPAPGFALRMRGLSKRYVLFCLVGGVGLCVDMLVLHWVSSPSLLGWSLILSKVVAAETALLQNFILNDLWTFRGLGRSAQGPGWAGRLLRFNLICAAGIGLSVLLLTFQVSALHWNLYVANFVAIVVSSFSNFLLSLRFGWGTAVANSTPEPPHVEERRAN